MIVKEPIGRRKKILFFAEAVTLAHVARPAALAAALDREYEVHFAHCPRYRPLLGDLQFTEHSIYSIEPAKFMEALAAGKPLYDLETLQAYAAEDLELIDRVKPDIVSARFARLSTGFIPIPT